MRVFAIVLVAACAVLGACSRSVTQADFATAEEATQALVGAARSSDARELIEVLGAEAEPMVESGDPVQDRNARDRFVRAFEADHSLLTSAEGVTTLQVGADGWSFPYPLVQSEGRWRFDSSRGNEEIINRRVGANELSTLQSCLAFVDAEREYYVRNPQGDSLLQYAQKLLSSEGKKDGLYWQTSGAEAPSPLGERFARARGEGYFTKGSGKGEPFRGYVYRLLTGQGPHARGGAYDYRANGKLIGGFALVAFPAEYGSSGVRTFMVNHDGVVYSKDLGDETSSVAMAMKAFDPDESWRREVALEHAKVH